MGSDALCAGSARQDLLEITAPMRSRLMASVKDSTREYALADPDMWPCVKSAVGAALQRTLDHVELEIERNVRFSLLAQQSDEAVRGPSGGPLSGRLYRLRAFLLHHYLPHDKSFFGKLEDPVYVLLYILTCLPIFGLRTVFFGLVLLMLVVPGPPDEWQLMNFIVSFKSMQFLSSGCIHLMLGAAQYFACYSLHKDGLRQCIEDNGPGAGDAAKQFIDFFGNVVLVWIAFYFLPYSKKVAQDDCTSHLDLRAAQRAGGRLSRLLSYDLRCFQASVCLLLLLTLLLCRNPLDGAAFSEVLAQFNANLFWCSVFYSLLCLPFVPFVIPCVQVILTHCDATGYNGSGACVAFGWPAGAEEAGPQPEVARQLSHYAKLATGFLGLLERGRLARDAASRPGDYVLGDLLRGAARGAREALAAAAVSGRARAAARLAAAAARLRAALGVRAGARARARAAPRRGGPGAPGGPGGPGGPGSPGGAGPARGHGAAAAAAGPAPTVAALLPPPRATGGRGAVGGPALFCVELWPGAGVGAPWRVLRSYGQFRELAARLGPRCRRLQARFPPRRWGGCSGAQLESRRRGLELWLCCVLRDPLSQGPWAGELHAFLAQDTDDGGQDPEDVPGGRARCCLGLPSMLPQHTSPSQRPACVEQSPPSRAPEAGDGRARPSTCAGTDQPEPGFAPHRPAAHRPPQAAGPQAAGPHEPDSPGGGGRVPLLGLPELRVAGTGVLAPQPPPSSSPRTLRSQHSPQTAAFSGVGASAAAFA